MLCHCPFVPCPNLTMSTSCYLPLLTHPQSPSQNNRSCERSHGEPLLKYPIFYFDLLLPVSAPPCTFLSSAHSLEVPVSSQRIRMPLSSQGPGVLGRLKKGGGVVSISTSCYLSRPHPAACSLRLQIPNTDSAEDDPSQAWRNWHHGVANGRVVQRSIFLQFCSYFSRCLHVEDAP